MIGVIEGRVSACFPLKNLGLALIAPRPPYHTWGMLTGTTPQNSYFDNYLGHPIPLRRYNSPPILFLCKQAPRCRPRAEA